MRYLGRGITLTQEEAKEHTMRQAKHNEVKALSYYHWAIIAHGGIAGKIFIVYPNKVEKRFEIGYCIAPAFGGRGLTTEASRLVINFVGEEFVATAHPANKASIAVLEKLGFRRDMSRQNVEKYGSVRDYFFLNRKD
jgi:ribosomal-protein-alanine N-acetyltransferase